MQTRIEAKWPTSYKSMMERVKSCTARLIAGELVQVAFHPEGYNVLHKTLHSGWIAAFLQDKKASLPERDRRFGMVASLATRTVGKVKNPAPDSLRAFRCLGLASLVRYSRRDFEPRGGGPPKLISLPDVLKKWSLLQRPPLSAYPLVSVWQKLSSLRATARATKGWSWFLEGAVSTSAGPQPRPELVNIFQEMLTAIPVDLSQRLALAPDLAGLLSLTIILTEAMEELIQKDALTIARERSLKLNTDKFLVADEDVQDEGSRRGGSEGRRKQRMSLGLKDIVVDDRCRRSPEGIETMLREKALIPRLFVPTFRGATFSFGPLTFANPEQERASVRAGFPQIWQFNLVPDLLNFNAETEVLLQYANQASYRKRGWSVDPHQAHTNWFVPYFSPPDNMAEVEKEREAICGSNDKEVLIFGADEFVVWRPLASWLGHELSNPPLSTELCTTSSTGGAGTALLPYTDEIPTTTLSTPAPGAKAFLWLFRALVGSWIPFRDRSHLFLARTT